MQHIHPMFRHLNYLLHEYYHTGIYRIYLDRQVSANSVDPDEMLQNAASH